MQGQLEFTKLVLEYAVSEVYEIYWSKYAHVLCSRGVGWMLPTSLAHVLVVYFQFFAIDCLLDHTMATQRLIGALVYCLDMGSLM